MLDEPQIHHVPVLATGGRRDPRRQVVASVVLIVAYSLLAGRKPTRTGGLKDMNATDTNAVPEEKEVQTRLKSAARVVDLVGPTRGDDPDVPAGSGYVGYAAWLPPDASPIPHPWGGAIPGNREP